MGPEQVLCLREAVSEMMPLLVAEKKSITHYMSRNLKLSKYWSGHIKVI